MKKFLLIYITVFILLLQFASAQDTASVATKEEVTDVKNAVDGINETLLGLSTTVDALKKIKISGYIQVQYQIADSAGTSSFAGGDFPTNVGSRFQVRRGRFKLNYDNDLTQYVMEVDVTQNGLGIKDAYIWVKEPWLRTFALTGGAFYRPFGFEVAYSSGVRETPEQSRLFQTLFPGERELGAQLEMTAETGPLSYFNLKFGLFNGVLNNANENDRNKDFIGRIGFSLPLEEQSLGIDGGFSLYSGKVANTSKFIYSFDNASPLKRFGVDSTASNLGGNYGRAYYGGDLQIYYEIPSIGGMSLRGEYITGQQPGTSKSNSFYNPADKNFTSQLYLRNFSGWYVTYIQNIGLKNEFLLKYDLLDPNTNVDGADIGAPGSNLTAADIKYFTLGIGWIYHWDANVKFLLYYDNVMNEKVNPSASGALASYKDDIKDNVFTVRMQYKF
jgi:hypothetical protein